MILGYTWLKDHNPEVNWQTGEVQMNCCPPRCKGCHVIRKEQALRKKVEAKAVNICRSGPPPEHVEDSEEDETPLQMCEVEYEPGDKLFMMRILSELAVENLHATSTISQKLAEGACRASETRKGLIPLPNYAKEFESVRLANSKAEIKPTAPLSAFDKENSIEFPLDFLHYLYNYYMVCALFSHAYHMTHYVM